MKFKQSKTSSINNLNSKEKKGQEPINSKSKFGKRLKLILIFLTTLTVFTVIFFMFYFTSKFFDKYTFEFRSPISFHAPVRAIDRGAKIEEMIQKQIELINATGSAEAKSETDEEGQTQSFNIIPQSYAEGAEDRKDFEIINKYEHAEILHRVYILESSAGKNDGCKDKGKVNGYGFGQSTSVWNCFDSFDEVTRKVNAWFTKRFDEGLTLGKALCYYNEGIKKTNCPYYENYLSI